MQPSIIGHIDMDAFFASVEEHDKPYLKGFPVIIGSDPQGGKGRGVVSTANYRARTLGIHSALPISTAWKLCEQAHSQSDVSCVFISPHTERYSEVSKHVFSIVHTFVPTLLQMSIDEASLDLSHCKTYQHARILAENIKVKIKKETGLTCSIGIGPSRMIAKIASDAQKPDGLTVIQEKDVDAFLAPLSIRAIPGVGKVTHAKLIRLGIHTVKDAQSYSWDALQRILGKHGFALWEKVHGIDTRNVAQDPVKRKSIGKHYTFDTDEHFLPAVMNVINPQCTDIVQQLHKQGFRSFRTVVLTVRFSDFTTRTRSITVDEPLNSLVALQLKALKLVLPFFETKENPQGKAIRLIGVRIEHLQ